MDIYETNAGNYIIARERNGRFEAPMTREGQDLTGASAVCGRTIDDCAASPNVRKYGSLADAQRAVEGWM
jgi:hypothetical protein